MSQEEVSAAQVEAAVEEPVEEAATAAEPAQKEQEEVLVLPAERVKKPVRPDDSETKKKIEALQSTINKAKKRVEEIKELIEAKRTGRSKGSSEQQSIKNQLAELRLKFQALVAQKNGVRGQLDVLAKSRETARQNINSMKSTIKYTSVEQIDSRIVELESQIEHSSLSLNEEKSLLEQIKQLKKARNSVGQLASQMSQLTTDNSSADELRETIKALDDQINGIKASEEKLRAQLVELRAKEQEEGSDVPAMIQERDECREVCKAAYSKIQDLRLEHDEEWAEFKKQSKLFRMQMDVDRQRRQEQYLKERAERDAARAARMAETQAEPFDKEVTTCEQLSAYLSKYVVASGEAKAEEKREITAPEGFKPLEKKADDASDAWLLGTGGKKGKGGKKGGKGSGGAAAAAGPTGGERLTHSLDILEAFAVLALEVPTTGAKAAALVPEVESKKAAFLAKRAEVKEKGEAAAPAAEDSTPAAPADEGGEAGAAAVGPAPAPKGGRKANGKVVPLPKLDDAESWPSIGGGPPAAKPAAAAAAADLAEGEAAEAEEVAEEPGAEAEAAGDAGEEEEEVEKEAPAAPKDGVSVTLTVSEEGSVSLAIAN